MRNEITIATLIICGAAGAAAYLVIRDYDSVRRSGEIVQVFSEEAAPRQMQAGHKIEPPAAPARAPQMEMPRQAAIRSMDPAPPPKPAPRTRAQRTKAAAPIDEPAAREALALVGVDPAAERVWAMAINDTNLSADERRNLIEDLNETGFDNPRNLTAADLPMIESRIGIIERLAPSAMDEVNAAAFDEAYKDLLNMRRRLVQE